MELNQIHIGTSGWHYAHWRGPFYPRDLPVKKFLEYYTASFSTVEINNTFYHLPKKETLANWRDTVPEGFFFAVKASRFITHMKKLKDPERSLAPFLEGVEILREKLGPILFLSFCDRGKRRPGCQNAGSVKESLKKERPEPFSGIRDHDAFELYTLRRASSRVASLPHLRELSQLCLRAIAGTEKGDEGVEPHGGRGPAA